METDTFHALQFQVQGSDETVSGFAESSNSVQNAQTMAPSANVSPIPENTASQGLVRAGELRRRRTAAAQQAKLTRTPAKQVVSDPPPSQDTQTTTESNEEHTPTPHIQREEQEASQEPTMPNAEVVYAPLVRKNVVKPAQQAKIGREFDSNTGQFHEDQIEDPDILGNDHEEESQQPIDDADSSAVGAEVVVGIDTSTYDPPVPQVRPSEGEVNAHSVKNLEELVNAHLCVRPPPPQKAANPPGQASQSSAHPSTQQVAQQVGHQVPRQSSNAPVTRPTQNPQPAQRPKPTVAQPAPSNNGSNISSNNGANKGAPNAPNAPNAQNAQNATSNPQRSSAPVAGAQAPKKMMGLYDDEDDDDPNVNNAKTQEEMLEEQYRRARVPKTSAPTTKPSVSEQLTGGMVRRVNGQTPEEELEKNMELDIIEDILSATPSLKPQYEKDFAVSSQDSLYNVKLARLRLENLEYQTHMQGKVRGRMLMAVEFVDFANNLLKPVPGVKLTSWKQRMSQQFYTSRYKLQIARAVRESKMAESSPWMSMLGEVAEDFVGNIVQMLNENLTKSGNVSGEAPVVAQTPPATLQMNANPTANAMTMDATMYEEMQKQADEAYQKSIIAAAEAEQVRQERILREERLRFEKLREEEEALLERRRQRANRQRSTQRRVQNDTDEESISEIPTDHDSHTQEKLARAARRHGMSPDEYQEFLDYVAMQKRRLAQAQESRPREKVASIGRMSERENNENQTDGTVEEPVKRMVAVRPASKTPSSSSVATTPKKQEVPLPVILAEVDEEDTTPAVQKGETVSSVPKSILKSTSRPSTTTTPQATVKPVAVTVAKTPLRSRTKPPA